MTESIDKNDKTTEEHTDEIVGELEKGFDTLLSIGRMWASHGLRMGRSALQTSARTLDVTADTLSDLAHRFESRR